MRKLIAVLVGVLLPAIVLVPVAEALPSTVNLRIEGKEETLFEGRVPASIEKIKASSDTQERDCDGVNSLDPQNTAPGITPTLAAVEAMESIGETFDGQWYEGFDDYFIKRWGPDAQDPAEGAYWGVLVNETYTNVGGCQYQLDENDESLWIWNAFEGVPRSPSSPKQRTTRAVRDRRGRSPKWACRSRSKWRTTRTTAAKECPAKNPPAKARRTTPARPSPRSK